MCGPVPPMVRTSRTALIGWSVRCRRRSRTVGILSPLGGLRCPAFPPPWVAAAPTLTGARLPFANLACCFLVRPSGVVPGWLCVASVFVACVARFVCPALVAVVSGAVAVAAFAAGWAWLALVGCLCRSCRFLAVPLSCRAGVVRPPRLGRWGPRLGRWGVRGGCLCFSVLARPRILACTAIRWQRAVNRCGSSFGLPPWELRTRETRVLASRKAGARSCARAPPGAVHVTAAAAACRRRCFAAAAGRCCRPIGRWASGAGWARRDRSLPGVRGP